MSVWCGVCEGVTLPVMEGREGEVKTKGLVKLELGAPKLLSAFFKGCEVMATALKSESKSRLYQTYIVCLRGRSESQDVASECHIIEYFVELVCIL